MGKVSIITDTGEVIPVAAEAAEGRVSFKSGGIDINFEVIKGKHLMDSFAAYSVVEAETKFRRDGSIGIAKKTLIEGYNFYIHHER